MAVSIFSTKKRITMNTINLVDPAARDFALAFAAFDPTRQTLAEYRQALDAAMAAAAPAEAPAYDEAWAPRPGATDKPVRMLVYRPNTTSGSKPAILFIHASGYIAGEPEWMASANAAMAQEHGAVVVAVNYRLAPETSFPGPIEDCYIALRWIHENAGQLGIDRSRVVVMGESAGGGLAAALAQLARDRGEFDLAGQVLIYPMLDPRTGTPDAPRDNPTAGEFIWTRRHNQFGWNAMRGEGDIPADRIGHFAPALAPNLADLPPAFVVAGALDLFVDEDADYALRLSHAGVQVELHIYPGGVHGFDLTGAAIASQYKLDLNRALGRMLGNGEG
jgi:acetyl esterase